MVAYYGSDEVGSSVLVFPHVVKDGDTAFKLAHSMNIYDYMNKIDTPEYGRVKATTENLVQEVHDYDRAMNWSCSARSQAFSPCTRGAGVYGS